MAVTYGALNLKTRTNGGLSAWQMQRAKELLLDDLAVNRSVSGAG
ncbi:hypothetical protein [Mesorhizobium sp. M0091]